MSSIPSGVGGEVSSSSNRTESNQSSSDDLHELDVVDEESGWATVSSTKKNKKVRREQ
jgi:hypothetical protein